MISSTIQLDDQSICTLPQSSSLRGINLRTNTLNSCSIEAEKGLAKKQFFSLQESTTQIEPLLGCSISTEFGASKITTSGCLDIEIQFQDYSPLLPGDRVTRMGRHGWNGQVLQIEINSVLVQWGNRTEWLDRVEVYPLDRFGKPRIPGKVDSISIVAQRARLTLRPGRTSKISTATNNQLGLF
ncbi:hypothetical protein [Egbenema bharatensis]|uniref:hypothetical protein n=1 Tax=Egbenema bharatensis TaxID=3463334 RepID=UPI003A8958EF